MTHDGSYTVRKRHHSANTVEQKCKTHFVNVVDAEETELDKVVDVGLFITPAADLVGVGVHVWASVSNQQAVLSSRPK